MIDPVYWFISAPRVDDHRNVYINGLSRCVHSLPATGCVCARRKDSGRVLPWDCPDEWIGRAEVTPHKAREHRITSKEFPALRSQLEPLLPPPAAEAAPLQPGDAFQPVLLNLPSTPSHDFLWPSIHGFVVSDRIRKVLESHSVKGVLFCRVEFEKVGRGPASAELNTRGGEPEGQLRKARKQPDTAELPKYWWATILSKTGFPPGTEMVSICEACGEAVIDPQADTRRFEVTERIWPDADFALLRTTRYGLVTDRVKKLIEGAEATNVRFSPTP